MSSDRAIALRVFEEVRARFPRLEMRIDPSHPHVDILVEIPRQPGLAFDVQLNLQGDELHLDAGQLWVEWFPCGAPGVAEAYLDAVEGLLSGRYRILEHLRGDKAVRAQLQRPAGSGWSTIATSSTLHLPIPWRTTTRVLRNVGE